MKNLIFFILLLVLSASCRTAQQKADRFIQKAIALDPTVIEEMKTKHIISDTIPFYLPIFVPEERDSRSINIDSLYAVLSDSIKTVILSSGQTEVTAKPGKNAGEIEFELIRPEQNLSVDTFLVYADTLFLPGKAIKTRVARPAYSYGWFWVLLVYSILATFLFVKTLSSKS